jgi:hypothetical protein
MGLCFLSSSSTQASSENDLDFFLFLITPYLLNFSRQKENCLSPAADTDLCQDETKILVFQAKKHLLKASYDLSFVFI